MANEGFIEIETPTLCKSTPEGARDYLVPSRIHPGAFYALPQSPQLYKQLLMCSGFDRYIQIARCYRDEDLRADRQPEFTQVDMELSFVDIDDVIDVNERLLQALFKEILDVDVQLPIPRMTWQEAMDRYGSDKPDTRFGMEIVNVTDVVKDCGFGVFTGAIENGGTVRGLNVKGQGAMPRKKIDKLVDMAKGNGAKGLAYLCINEDGTYKSSFAKFMTEEELDNLVKAMDGEKGDLLLFAADKNKVVWNVLGALRLELGEQLELIDKNKLDDITASYVLIGETNDKATFEYGYDSIPMDEALKVWEKPLEKVFPTRSHNNKSLLDTPVYDKGSIYVCKNKVAKPTVFIPVFPGTNCEYDSAKAFDNAAANVITKVFKNLTPEDIRDSVNIFEKAISQAQIIMFPGGFSAGDEPDGSAKFFATAFRNEKIKEAVHKLLNERDGLALGICNGFQALIKLGLVPNGQITGQNENSPTLTYNTINRHVSKMVYTKVVSNKSPWLQLAELGGTYVNPASHGEGRFVAPEECIKELFANGQVATQYVNEQGQPTMDEEWNVNGSYYAIEGITSPDGRCLGKMAHIERKGISLAMNIFGEQDLKVFEAGVKYFK